MYFPITFFGHKNVYFIFKMTHFRPFSEYKLYYETMYYSSIQPIKVHILRGI